jgi:hypothetical protein
VWLAVTKVACCSKDLTASLSNMFLYNLLHWPSGVVPVTMVREGETVYTCPVEQQDKLAKIAAQVSVSRSVRC